MEGGALWGIFVQTFKATIRSKWLIMFTFVFFFFAFNVPFIMLQVIGLLPANYVPTYIATLISTSFTLMPLLALPLGAVSIVEERESGSLSFVLSTPTSRLKFLVARTLGLFIATSSIIILGFLLAALIGYISAGVTSEGASLAYVTEAAILINATMLGLAMVVSTLSRKRLTAHSVAILIWFLFTYAGATAEGSVSTFSTNAGYSSLLPWIFMNPTEMGRILALLQIPAGPAGSGLNDVGSTGLAILYFFHTNAVAVLLGAMGLWIAITLIASFIIFNFQDIA